MSQAKRRNYVPQFHYRHFSVGCMPSEDPGLRPRRAQRICTMRGESMDRVVVSSSDIRSIGYDPASCTLEIEFHGGRVYRYASVPEPVYNQLLAASSKGQFFDRAVKHAYRFVRFI